MQHVELTMVTTQLVNNVASIETREGCPITPGHSLVKDFSLTPLATYNADKRGVALDGYLKVQQSKFIIETCFKLLDSLSVISYSLFKSHDNCNGFRMTV